MQFEFTRPRLFCTPNPPLFDSQNSHMHVCTSVIRPPSPFFQHFVSSLWGSVRAISNQAEMSHSYLNHYAKLQSITVSSQFKIVHLGAQWWHNSTINWYLGSDALYLHPVWPAQLSVIVCTQLAPSWLGAGWLWLWELGPRFSVYINLLVLSWEINPGSCILKTKSGVKFVFLVFYSRPSNALTNRPTWSQIF